MPERDTDVTTPFSRAAESSERSAFASMLLGPHRCAFVPALRSENSALRLNLSDYY